MNYHQSRNLQKMTASSNTGVAFKLPKIHLLAIIVFYVTIIGSKVID